MNWKAGTTSIVSSFIEYLLAALIYSYVLTYLGSNRFGESLSTYVRFYIYVYISLALFPLAKLFFPPPNKVAHNVVQTYERQEVHAYLSTSTIVVSPPTRPVYEYVHRERRQLCSSVSKYIYLGGNDTIIMILFSVVIVVVVVCFCCRRFIVFV